MFPFLSAYLGTLAPLLFVLPPLRPKHLPGEWSHLPKDLQHLCNCQNSAFMIGTLADWHSGFAATTISYCQLLQKQLS